METPTCDLSKLFMPWFKVLPPCRIHHLALSSKYVAPGSLFFALAGHTEDGRRYIEEAIHRGASAVAAEGPARVDWIGPNQEIPYIQIPDLRKKISGIAGVFYEHPSHRLKLVGITGTNGKTTVSHLVAQWSSLLQCPSAVIGTLGYGPLNRLLEPIHSQQHHATTPSPIQLQQLLHEYVARQIRVVALEMSSHGIDQARGSGLTFAVGAITNITREHLDYHGDFEAYTATKRSFFQTHDMRHRVCNIDDPQINRLAQSLSEPMCVSLQSKPPEQWTNTQFIGAIRSHYTTSGIDVQCISPWGKAAFHTPLLGKFNGTNLLMAAACMLALGFPLDQLAETCSQLKPITGRLEKLNAPGQPIVFIDYAHTPDALEQALGALRELTKGRLICVFGCAGERDKTKRPVMGRIAERYADVVILTDDNPRGESPDYIFKHILDGMVNPKAVRCIHHRKEAITLGFKLCSKEEDVLLIAGKGHEKVQVYERETLTMSDHDIVQDLLNGS